MTDRLYYEDSHLAAFPAVVTACEQEKDYWKVALDQTAFFPEGGGQAGDTGHLGEIEVFDTHEKNGEIWHYTRQSLKIGAEVKGVLDWKKRFSRMQQHSGRAYRLRSYPYPLRLRQRGLPSGRGRSHYGLQWPDYQRGAFRS